MQCLLLHGGFESGSLASVVGTNEKQVQNLFSVCVTLCGIFCLICQLILRTHALPLSSKHSMFSGTEVLFYSSSSCTETIHKARNQEGKEAVVPVGRKWKNGSSTIMFLEVSSIYYIVLAQKCANQMLSF